MTKEEALERLELEGNATPNEIKAQYNEFYNEFQIRITNAPTDHQRKLYQKKLEELEQAYSVLGGEQDSSDVDLPSMALTDSPEAKVVSPEEKVKTDLIKARNVLKVSESSSRQQIVDEYQSHKLELIELISARSGNIAEVAREELEAIESAVRVLVSDLSEQEFKPEIYGKKKSKRGGKLNLKPLVYIFIGVVVIGFGYYLYSSGVFESNHQRDLDKAIGLLEDTGDWQAAEPIFESLLDSPVGEEAETWLMTISTIKKGEAEKFKESFTNYLTSGNLIEAEKYFDKYNEISPLIKDDNELYVQWLKSKSDLETMKADYNRFIKDGKDQIAKADFDTAESNIKEAMKIYPTSEEIKPLLSEIKTMRIKYADCFAKMEEAGYLLELYGPGESEYENIRKMYQQVVNDCPNIQAAKDKLNEME